MAARTWGRSQRAASLAPGASPGAVRDAAGATVAAMTDDAPTDDAPAPDRIVLPIHRRCGTVLSDDWCDLCRTTAALDECASVAYVRKDGAGATDAQR